MKKGLLITIGVIVGFIVLWILVFGGIYNKLVTGEEGVTSAWAQVENVYQRRMDLVPNLVATVKGYAAHERETLQGVAKCLQTVRNPFGVVQTVDTENDLAVWGFLTESSQFLGNARTACLVGEVGVVDADGERADSDVAGRGRHGR